MLRHMSEQDEIWSDIYKYDQTLAEIIYAVI